MIVKLAGLMLLLVVACVGVTTAQPVSHTVSPTPTYTMEDLLADTNRLPTLDQFLDEEFSCRLDLALDRLEPTPTLAPTSAPILTPPRTPYVAVRKPGMSNTEYSRLLLDRYLIDLEALRKDPEWLDSAEGKLDKEIQESIAQSRIMVAEILTEYLKNCEKEYGGS